MTFLLPFIAIVVFGSLFGWWLSAVVRYQIFEYRKLWLTAHRSKEWREEIKPRAVWRDGRRCIWCSTRKRLEGHYRRYIGRLGRACGWRDTSTFCNGCHACFGGHEWLEAIAAAEKGYQADPLLHGLPRLWEMDDATGAVARPAAVQGVQQQDPAHRAPARSEAGEVEPLGPLPAVAEHLPDLRAVPEEAGSEAGKSATQAGVGQLEWRP